MVSQVAQFAPEFDVILEEVSVDLRATFDSSAKYNLSDNPTAFQKVAIKLYVRSPSPLTQINRLIAHAEKGCHAAQSLRNPVDVIFEAQVNGTAMA
ncbi:MAG: OsmC family protein [Anaerolineales bacterium]